MAIDHGAPEGDGMPQGGESTMRNGLETHRRGTSEIGGNRAPWYRRLAFWRAVAGMGFALAIASVIVGLELTSEFSLRTSRYLRKISRLSGQLEGARAERAARDNLNHILADPDSTIVRLAPRMAGGSESGLVAVSFHSRRAALEVAGLPQLHNGRLYVLWWLPLHGEPIKAATFRTDGEGRASVTATMPHRESKIGGAMITEEADGARSVPGGEVQLRGMLVSR